MCAIAVTATSAFADEGCETKPLSRVEASKNTESAKSGKKTPESCESTISKSIEPANSSRQTTSEPGKNIVYFGGGISRKSDDFDALEEFGDFSDNNLAFTLGYLRVPNKGRLIGGVDISYEGTMLDGTFSSYSTRGALSFNGIVGVNVAKNNSVRLDVAGLLGAREKTVDCPASYLGYACYADLPPDRSYSVNYGGIVSFSYKKLMLGARATGASTQGLVGIRF